METHEHDSAGVELIEVIESEVAADSASTQVEPDANSATGSTSTGDTFADLERALAKADISASGFEGALRSVLAPIGGTLLFVMPGAADETSVAAINLASGEAHETLLAILDRDGRTVRFEKAAQSGHPVAGLAASWTRVMERMPAIAA